MHPKGRRLADLRLHKVDLAFASECLDSISRTPDHPPVQREALWRSAVIHFNKCFGENKSRGSLSAVKIYRGNPSALRRFKYLSSLRDKHIVHDENSYLQSVPWAVVNKENAGRKIAGVGCATLSANSLNDINFRNLRQLVTEAWKWVDARYDEVRQQLVDELEAKEHRELIAMEEARITMSSAHDDVHQQRPR